ncbi:MAG: riboflavin synthase [Bacteroidia bacterium]
MFTGIIESLGIVQQTEQAGTNRNLWISVPFIDEIKIDQSIAHNGVCLTVVAKSDSAYKVTAIAETLKLTNLGALVPGDRVNLERCLRANGRFDGHMVQGHVDGQAICRRVESNNGSWEYTFHMDHPDFNKLVVQKGSICINGVSLTVTAVGENSFDVAIIPFTYEHTNLNRIGAGDSVNIEFDILGKYIAHQLELRIS